MAKIHGEGLAPNAKVTNVEDGQVLGQGQHDCLALVATQRVLLAILVRNPQAVGSGPLATTHPEFGICNFIFGGVFISADYQKKNTNFYKTIIISILISDLLKLICLPSLMTKALY